MQMGIVTNEIDHLLDEVVTMITLARKGREVSKTVDLTLNQGLAHQLEGTNRISSLQEAESIAAGDHHGDDEFLNSQSNK
mmetsp:Transcript_27041/g.40944  ORF Transcript_27041/g.40944 Transcript_27041/m.40944 type:complete len:80 (+) Transcript_27041:4044-4283(+)